MTADLLHSTASREACTARIRALGARATPARVAVLRLLEGAERALSHHDFEAALADAGFDRVTLYRVLEWLVEVGLAHRTIDAQRVFRFSIALGDAPSHSAHAHFRCETCGRVYCLADVRISSPTLPAGFAARTLEFCITGLCASCERCQNSDPTP